MNQKRSLTAVLDDLFCATPLRFSGFALSAACLLRFASLSSFSSKGSLSVAEFAQRPPSLYVLCMVIFFTAYAAQRLFGTKEAVVGSAILISSPLFFVAEALQTKEAIIAALLSAFFLCLLLNLRENAQTKKGLSACAGVFLAVAFATGGLQVLLIPLLALVLWFIFEKRSAALFEGESASALMLSFLLVSLPIVLWLGLKDSGAVKALFVFGRPKGGVRLSLIYFLLGTCPWVFPLLKDLTVKSAGLFKRKEGNDPMQAFLFCWIFSPLLISLFISSSSPLMLIASLPAVALYLAGAFVRAEEKSGLAGNILLSRSVPLMALILAAAALLIAPFAARSFGGFFLILLALIPLLLLLRKTLHHYSLMGRVSGLALALVVSYTLLELALGV